MVRFHPLCVMQDLMQVCAGQGDTRGSLQQLMFRGIFYEPTLENIRQLRCNQDRTVHASWRTASGVQDENANVSAKIGAKVDECTELGKTSSSSKHKKGKEKGMNAIMKDDNQYEKLSEKDICILRFRALLPRIILWCLDNNAKALRPRIIEARGTHILPSFGIVADEERF